MSYEKTWSGDWHQRILERVRKRGFATMSEYARQKPHASLMALADDLGPDDIAATQIRTVLVTEARRDQALPRALRDLFVRELHYALPHGWEAPLSDEARSKLARALARWKSELTLSQGLDCLDDERTVTSIRGLLDAQLPKGWLPLDAEDPIAVNFVDRCLNRASS